MVAKMKKRAREEVETVPHFYINTLKDIVSDTEYYSPKPKSHIPRAQILTILKTSSFQLYHRQDRK